MPLSSHAQNPHHGLWVPEPEDWVAVSLELQWEMCGHCCVLDLIFRSVDRCQKFPQNEEVPLALPSKHHSLWDPFVHDSDTKT